MSADTQHAGPLPALARLLAPLGERHALPAVHAVLATVFVLLVLASAGIAWGCARRARGRAIAEVVAGLAAVHALALTVRVALSPRTFLHEYYHVAETLQMWLHSSEPNVWGETGPALFRLAGALCGCPGEPGVIFAVDLALASLAPPLLAALDLVLFGQLGRALCSGALLAVLPLHVRWSASEDLFVANATFALWALLLWALYLRTRRFRHVLAAALATALVVDGRPEMVLFPLVLAVLALADPAHPRGGRAVLVAPPTLAALALLTALFLPRLAVFLRLAAHDAAQAHPSLVDPGKFLAAPVLWDGTVTSPALWALLAAGLAYGWRHRRGLHVWLLSSYGAFVVLSTSLYGHRLYHQRTQLLPTALLCLLGGSALSWWCGRRPADPAWRRLGYAVIALAIAAASLPRIGYVVALGDQQLEWAFLRRTVPRLPPAGGLLAQVDTGGDALDAFPVTLLSLAGHEYDAWDLRQVIAGAAWPTPRDDGTLLYYEGPHCYFHREGEAPPHPITERCRAVRDRYALRPLIVEELDGPPYSPMSYSAVVPPFRVGFYRLIAWKGAAPIPAPATPPRSLLRLPRTIPPEAEPRVRALFAPLALADPIADGVSVRSLDVVEDRVVLWLAGPAVQGDAHVIVEAPGAHAPAHERVGPVRMRSSPGVPPAVLAALRAALAGRGDHEVPWIDQPPAIQPRLPLPLFGWLLAFAVLAWAAVEGAGRLRRAHRR